MCNRALPPLAAILALPLLAFDFGYLAPGPALAAAALLVGALAFVFQDARRGPPVDRKLMAACVGLGLLVVLLSGGGHFLYRTDDWTIRDALLVDLVRQPWPVSYMLDEKLLMLRAPLGMYLIPALAGKAFGLFAADLAMSLQNALGLGLVLYLIAQAADTLRRRIVVLGIFLLFSGMDVLPSLLLYAVEGVSYRLPHLDGWGGSLVQYSAHMTLMFWVPNHALAGWSFAAAYLTWRRGEADLSVVGLFFALGLLWSPLAMMGALVLGTFALLSAVRDRQITGRMFVAPVLAGLAAAPAVLFLTVGSGTVTRAIQTDPGFLIAYVILMLVSVAPYILFMRRDPVTWQDRPLRQELWWLAVPLLMFPFYSIGEVNDFTRRAIIPITAVLALRFGLAVARASEQRFKGKRWIVAVMLLAVMTPAGEILRNLLVPGTAQSTCNLMDAWQSGHDRGRSLAHYLVAPSALDSPPGLFRAPGGDPVRGEGRHCWGDGQRHYVTNKQPLLDEAPHD
ncbi:MAG: hypothetical protein JWM36_2897 [Hyphomicrobiales bacterium]|nr:hypothetical protein [Hyphomicrobiales bacterium]